MLLQKDVKNTIIMFMLQYYLVHILSISKSYYIMWYESASGQNKVFGLRNQEPHFKTPDDAKNYNPLLSISDEIFTLNFLKLQCIIDRRENYQKINNAYFLDCLNMIDDIMRNLENNYQEDAYISAIACHLMDNNEITSELWFHFELSWLNIKAKLHVHGVI